MPKRKKAAKGTINNGVLCSLEQVIVHYIYDHFKVLVITVSIFAENEDDVKYLEPSQENLKDQEEQELDDEVGNDDEDKRSLKGVGIPTHIGKLVLYRTRSGLHRKAWAIPTTGQSVTLKDCEADFAEVAKRSKVDLNNNDILKLEEDFLKLVHRS